MNIIELINLIKPRPELFIHEHDIFCLYSFLNGWYYRNREEDVKANILYNDFYYWLRKKYHLRDTRGWASILFYKFKTKEKALDAFFELFDTFYQEHISRDFLGKVEWLIITLEDEAYDETERRSKMHYVRNSALYEITISLEYNLREEKQISKNSFLSCGRIIGRTQ